MKRLLLILTTFTVWAAAAQERFDYVVRRNAWNGSVNASGIRQDTLSRSYAEIYFTKENGGFTNYSGSDNSWNAGASTASIRHYDKVSFAGGFTYDYFDGRDMCGSMFTRPGYYPVDILEFTPGRKVRETYAFTGSVAAVLGQRWTGGLKIDFEAQNYAKRKDLRHKNKLLDFEFAPAIMYHTGRFAIGGAYIFGKNSDVVEADRLGKSGINYYAFFDKGMEYGDYGVWDGQSLHLTEAGVVGFPVREIVHGAGLQVQYGAFYADAVYRSRNGETGEKDVQWHAFEASQLTANAALWLPNGERSHFVRFKLNFLTQDTRESLIGKETIGGLTHTYIYGSTPMSGRRSLDLGLEYEYAAPKTDLRAGATCTMLSDESRLMYPYVKGRESHYMTVYAGVIQKLGFWELSLAADFRKGGFDESEKQYPLTVTPGDYPYRLTEYFNYETEYLTAPRVGAALGVRRNIEGLYIDLSARYEHGFDLRYVSQPNRLCARLSVGYNF